jgi:DDE superfamily endonuclease
VDSIPVAALPLLGDFAPVFTHPTYRRFTRLLVAAILTTGCRTVANLLRTAGNLAPGDASSCQRVLSQARWSGLCLSAALCRSLLRHLWPQGRVRLVGDDTVTEHRGKKVHGKARHRDPIRSSHAYTAWRWGHRWVVLAVLVRFPFANRPWALPVLVGLYRSPEDNRRRGRRHRTPAQVLQLLLRVLLRWFPGRHFVLAADGNYGSHALARFAQSQQGRLSLVSKLHPGANLHEPPPPYSGKGRPRVRGAKLPSPAQVVAQAGRARLTVAWYGGGTRRVEVVTGVGQWYQAGQGLVAVRWVFVHDRSGTHRDEYFYSTDVGLAARQIIEEYTGRWNIETTFQECRAYLGLGTTRGWSRRTVLRAEPCLFGLYTVVALLYEQLPAVVHEDWQVLWLGKDKMAFSDAVTAVRRWLWTDWVFPTSGHDEPFAKLPQSLQEVLLYALAPVT